MCAEADALVEPLRVIIPALRHDINRPRPRFTGGLQGFAQQCLPHALSLAFLCDSENPDFGVMVWLSPHRAETQRLLLLINAVATIVEQAFHAFLDPAFVELIDFLL